MIHNDMTIAGANGADHDDIVHQVLEHTINNKVKFDCKNNEQFKVNKVMYIGDSYTESGLQLDLGKLRAIIEMPVSERQGSLVATPVDGQVLVQVFTENDNSNQGAAQRWSRLVLAIRTIRSYRKIKNTTSQMGSL